MPRPPTSALALVTLAGLVAAPGLARAQAYNFSTGDVDGGMAIVARPGGPFEVEVGDDFVTNRSVRLTSATFTGLVTGDVAAANFARVQIYQLFPNNSDLTRTPAVPTRVNSPADVALLARETDAGLTFTATPLAPTFTAGNSVLNTFAVNTGTGPAGEGSVSGQLVRFNVTFTDPILLPAGHYFFVPQAGLSAGDFFWLSSVRPIVAPGTPFAPDLQAWARDVDREGAISPDWLRVGTDIVGGAGAPTFNAAFTLTGTVVPEPSTYALVAAGLLGVGALARRRRAVA